MSRKFAGNAGTMQRYNSSNILGYMARCNMIVFPEKYLDKILAGVPKNAKFLDAGCGVGQFSRQLILRSKEIGRDDISFHAFDFSHVMLSGRDGQKGALDNLDGLGVKTWQADIKKLDQIRDGGVAKFDYVISRDVLHFFTDEERAGALRNLREVCADGGVVRLELREKRFDKEQVSGFNDVSEFDWRGLLQDSGFEIKKSIIAEKTSYGRPGQDNLDRFYDRLILVSSPRKELEPSKKPFLADDYSERRAKALQNKGRNTKSEVVFL